MTSAIPAFPIHPACYIIHVEIHAIEVENVVQPKV